MKMKGIKVNVIERLVKIVLNLYQRVVFFADITHQCFNVDYLLRITKRAGISAFYSRNKLKNHNQFIIILGVPALFVRQYNAEKNPLRRALLYSSSDEREDYGGMKIAEPLQASSSVEAYFKKCNFLPYQRIIKEFDYGNFRLSSYIDSLEQLFPLVQYWIPHLTIISPPIWLRGLKIRITT